MIDKVEQWLANLDIDVNYHADEMVGDQYDYSTGVVHILDRDSKTFQLFRLLHEAGHVMLRHDADLHKELYPTKYQPDPEVSNWIEDVLQEEYDAWSEGYYIAQELGLNVCVDTYEEHADSCLNGYRALAVTVTNFEQGIIDSDDDSFDMVVSFFQRVSNGN